MRALKKRFPDFYLVIAWDLEAKRKKEAFPEYKANRPGFRIDDPVLDLKKVFSSVRVAQAEMPGEEADDVMASLASTYSKEGLVYIYSSDKDMLQLVEDGKVVVIKPKSGPNPEKIYDEERVKSDFGIYPKNFACYLSFRGDTSDNIPGVPRAQSKIIASLAEKYGEPRKVYGSLSNEKFTEYQRKNIKEHEQQVYLNYELVKLREDLNIAVSEGSPNPELLGFILDKYEIRSIKPDSYIDVFEKESSFLSRNAPAFENFSLF